jgi:hypothetical protein
MADAGLPKLRLRRRLLWRMLSTQRVGGCFRGVLHHHHRPRSRGGTLVQDTTKKKCHDEKQQSHHPPRRSSLYSNSCTTITIE